ncbi:MAG TPA: DNA helicase UvrD, partial [Oribacterium sp.]|nr:DNA helicase UvrD [Oribacterium sp.]
TIMMMENYRSTPEILAVANALIRKNRQRIEKELIPMQEAGVPVVCHLAEDSTKEAEWIVKNIETLHQMGVTYNKMTVMYRAHYVTRTIEEVLLRSKIPYTIYSGVQFFGRMEIKDALCYLRMIVYKDDLSFRRIANVPKRNLGVRRMKFLEEYTDQHGGTLYSALVENLDQEIFRGTKAKEFVALIEGYAASYHERTISEVLTSILNESGYEKLLRTEGAQDRLDNLAELKQAVFSFETSAGEETDLESYLTSVAMLSNMDIQDSSDRVKLMTVHTAKGLEFPYVFLCSMSEGIFPSKKVKTLEGMEEERRLAFVAMTRAEKGLYLSEAAGRNFDGSPRYPSRFILDIDPALLHFTEAPKAGLLKEAKSYIALVDRSFTSHDDAALFHIGDRVRHRAFGLGTIQDVDLDQSAYTIQFDELPTERRLSMRVKLERVALSP